MFKILFISLLCIFQSYIVTASGKTSDVEKIEINFKNSKEVDVAIDLKFREATDNDFLKMTGGSFKSDNTVSLKNTIKFPIDINKLPDNILGVLSSWQKNCLYGALFCGAVWGISYCCSEKIGQDKKFYKDAINQCKDTARQAAKIFFALFCITYFLRKKLTKFINFN